MNVRGLSSAAISMTALLGGCAVTPTGGYTSAEPMAQSVNAPMREGALHLAGNSSALFHSREIDDVEEKSFGFNVSAGKMIRPRILAEGEFSFINNDVDFGGADVETTDFMLGGGARYYFPLEGNSNTYPYARGTVGLLHESFDAGAVDDDDTAPYITIGGGAETFITEWLALDYGLRLMYAFDVFDDDLTDVALYLGLSLWK